MKHFTLLLSCLFLSFTLSAQYTWDGGGDGTSWNDAMNWDRDEVPALDSMVIFTTDVTVTGTAPNNPISVRINSQADVVLDLDLTVGNGITDQHAITFGDTCSLTVATGRTITANTEIGKHTMAIFGGSEMVAVTIDAGATFESVAGLSGINLANGASTVTNNGTVIMRQGLRDGIRVVGNFINNGTVTGEALERDLFNVKDGGILTNSASGTITSDQPGDDGIDLLTEASFVNDGVLMLTAKDNASSGNNPISVGNTTTAASFVNNSDNVTLSGGGGAGDLSGRALSVDTLGVFTNNGSITLIGGDDGSRLSIKGSAENALNGIIDFAEGRFNVNVIGTFVNNGLVRSTRDGAGGFVTGIATNNGFYDYSMSNQFASGAMGTITDNGISLNNNDTRVNARNECAADIASTPYEWFLNGVAYATASDTGLLAFAEESLLADSVILTTTIPGVEITVFNICEAAVMTSGVFSPSVTAEIISVFPNPVRSSGVVTLDLSSLSADVHTFRIINISGQLLGEYQLSGGGNADLPLNNLKPGTYFINAITTDGPVLSRLVVTN